MFDRFTDRARYAMGFSRQESQRFSHDYIGPEHMLLGLLKTDGTATALLRNLKVRHGRLRGQVEGRMKRGATMVTMGQLPFTPGAKRVLELSLNEAHLLGHNYIGTEHLLLGLVREPRSIAGEVLREAGLSLETLREAVLEAVGGSAAAAPSANMELKARCADLAAARKAALAHGAVAEETLHQQDVYYYSYLARLKLRRMDGGRSELISYVRRNMADIRRSDYEIVPVDDPEAVHTALEAALGVRRVVTKTRELLLWENVRIHLDTVEGLGTFIELEAVVGPDADEALSRNRVVLLCAALGIRDEDFVAGSYADL